MPASLVSRMVASCSFNVYVERAGVTYPQPHREGSDGRDPPKPAPRAAPPGRPARLGACRGLSDCLCKRLRPDLLLILYPSILMLSSLPGK